jgi:mycothiol synthase
MNTLTWRSYQGEQDLWAIADLANRCAIADQIPDSFTSVDELRADFNAPSFQPARDLRLWEDAGGQLIGFAMLWIPEFNEIPAGNLWFNLHPEVRDRGVEQEMIGWAETVMRRIGQERGVSTRLHTAVRETLTHRIAFLEREGFQPIRYFFRMERSLQDPIPAPGLPEGFTLYSMNDEQDIHAWVDMFNQSFIDHWNHHEMTLEEYFHGIRHGPNYQPELDLVAIAPDGTFAAFCYSEIDPIYNAHVGKQIGGVHLLGSRRGFRRIGLGRAMLLTGLHRLQTAGMEIARLGVDTKNPSGANHLYESVGFKQVLTNIVFARSV